MRVRDNGRDLGHVIFLKYLNNVFKKSASCYLQFFINKYIPRLKLTEEWFVQNHSFPVDHPVF